MLLVVVLPLKLSKVFADGSHSLAGRQDRDRERSEREREREIEPVAGR